ncbi:transcription initiation factor IIE, beta subunit [Russula aff. rugulosa BPL654]|nr:transcription initiation factor IIE, beta subunit [Russula aff. rugulosa BPL654]
MSSFAAASKTSLQNANITPWHSNQASASSSQPATPPDSDSGKKKKRPKSTIVYSQPADTGTGTDVNTQLLYAINHLKANNGPMRLDDLAIRTQTPLDADKVLFEKFRAHERVEFDIKTNLYSFKHDYNFRSKAALLTEIQRSTRRGGGISVRTLKESWKDAPTAIEELEKEGEVFVTRTLRDGQMRMVFWNELRADPADLAEEGPEAVAKRDASKNGTGLSVEKEFHDLWHNLNVPNEVDLLKQLQSGGLQETASEAPVIKTPVGKRRGKKSGTRQRTTRLTNTHLKGMGIDLSKDYVAPGK